MINFINMMKFLPTILKDKQINWVFAAGLLILIIGFILAFSSLRGAGNLLVIHFDSFNGADFFGNKSDVVDILILSVIIWLINLFLANEFYYRERFLSYFFAYSSLIFSILILLAINAIISVN